MPTPQEIEAAAGLQFSDEVDRKRHWAAAQALASQRDAAPSAEDLRLAGTVLEAARAASEEHLSDGRGRAVITFTDAMGGDEFEISVELTPEPVELPNDEIQATPAQVVALEILESVFGGHEHDHEGHE